MNSLSISQLEQFSGIKAHTIRIWEQRYQALQPERSDGNVRYYSSDQLRRLLNIVSLMDDKYKISDLCRMSDAVLFTLLEARLKEKPASNNKSDYFILQLIAAGMKLDEVYFEKIFSQCILNFGLKNTYLNIVCPTLQRIGLLWASNHLPTVNEHFISNLIKQKLNSAIDTLEPPSNNRHTWLLLLPEHEFHEIGLLFSNYLLRKASKKVIYLGANVPMSAIQQIQKNIDISHVLIYFTMNGIVEETMKYLSIIRKQYPKAQIFMAGNENYVRTLKLSKNTHILKNVSDLSKLL